MRFSGDDAAQQCVPELHRDNAATVLEVTALSGRLRGLKMVPLKWRYPVLHTSRVSREDHMGRAAHRWAASAVSALLKP